MRYFTDADNPGDQVFRFEWTDTTLVTEMWDRVSKEWVDYPDLVRPDPVMDFEEISEERAKGMITGSTVGRV